MASTNKPACRRNQNDENLFTNLVEAMKEGQEQIGKTLMGLAMRLGAHDLKLLLSEKKVEIK